MEKDLVSRETVKTKYPISVYFRLRDACLNIFTLLEKVFYKLYGRVGLFQLTLRKCLEPHPRDGGNEVHFDQHLLQTETVRTNQPVWTTFKPDLDKQNHEIVTMNGNKSRAWQILLLRYTRVGASTHALCCGVG